MNIAGLTRGTRLVTSSGDVVELLSVQPDGISAQVRYVEVLGGEPAEGSEATISSDDIATLSGARFVGPT
jgi:hypothetical protein